MSVVFLDIDGTLVDYENRIPESAVEAIRKARENGHRVYLVSGRSKAEIYPEIWDIGLDGLIGGNGNYIETDSEVIFHEGLSREDTREIVDYLHQNGLEFYLECVSGLYASENLEEAALDAMREYSGNDEVTVRKFFPEMIFGGSLDRDDVNKISYLLNDYNDYLKMSERFANFKNGTWGGKSLKPLFGDIALSDIDKSTAIKRLIDYLGVGREETIAFGDAIVDTEMIEFCNTGVAMGNSEEEIKRIADFVTTKVDDDGLYNGFKELGLI